MLDIPRANRLAIAFFGRRNAGKSSLVNTLTGQAMSLISPIPGSTADPVIKSMELLPLGPVTIIDTAGLDDEGELGGQKIGRTKKILEEADLAVLVCDVSTADKSWEKKWLTEFSSLRERLLVVENKADLLHAPLADWLPAGVPRVLMSAARGEGISEFKEALVKLASLAPEPDSLIAGLFPPKSLFMLVAPQDKQAPKSRLILPQVQVIRDILDHHSLVLMAGLNEVETQMKALKQPPSAVVVDANVFGKVAEIIPNDWPLTAFSVIMARSKGDLNILLEGAGHLNNLPSEATILMAEACTHHAMTNDIAREVIPKLMQRKYGPGLKFETVAGADFPADLSPYDLIICCGSCMITRNQFMARLKKAADAQVPVTNFGLILAHLNGYLKRSVEIFIK